jgi:histone-binding protein RBBP4
VGDDGAVSVWDIRGQTRVNSTDEHLPKSSPELMSVDSSAFDQNLIVTGSMDSIVTLWDLRNLSQPLHQFIGHKGDIT